MKNAKRKIPGGIQLAIGFFLIILIGTLLLLLPISHQDGVKVSFIDALMVATSATCVTGLTPLDLSVSFSVFGTTVIMCLFQIGGLGYAMLAVSFITLFSGGGGLGSSNLLKDSFGAEHRIRTREMLRLAAVSTAIFELTGALFLFLQFSKDFPLGRAIYVSIFTSISAYNNAGFDLFSTSLVNYNDNPLVIITVSCLIIMGGLGYVVYLDILSRFHHKRFSLNTKIVVSVTLILLLVGMLLFHYAGGLDPLNAFFQSVTTRTAGFFALDQGKLNSFAITLTIILMFIGASPGSTGGGIKTTTLFAAMVGSFMTLRGKSPTAFGRAIAKESIMKAFFVIVLSVIILSLALLALTITEKGADSTVLLFEAVSAFATVGLTMGITPFLSDCGKIIIILLMYIGRVGILTILATSSMKTEKSRFVEEKINIG